MSRNFAEYLETNNQLLRDHATGLGVYITVMAVVFTVLAVLIPYFNNRSLYEQKNELEKLKNEIEKQWENFKSEIDKQRNELTAVKTKLQEDFQSKTNELIKNENEIELILRFKILKLLYNHIQSNVSVFLSNKIRKNTFQPYLFVSYILFYQLLDDIVYFMKYEKYKNEAGYIASSCFFRLNKAEPMLQLYDKINGGRPYNKIFSLIKYRDLFDPEFIKFLEEVKRREDGKSSADGGK